MGLYGRPRPVPLAHSLEKHDRLSNVPQLTSVTIVPMLAAHLVTPSVATTPPSTWTSFYLVSLLGQVLGILLLTIATLRARVFPRWIPWLLIVTLVLGLVSQIPFVPEALSNLTAILASVAIAGFGYALLWPDRLEHTQPILASVQAEAHA